MHRINDRKIDELRSIKITRNFTCYAEGSVLIEIGNTKVICTAMVENRVPIFLRGENKGWISAEYDMLPGANANRKQRDRNRGKIDGRTNEIQRLIGRSLRSVVDLTQLGENTIWIDCDVIQADGGTRTASITGAYIALVDAVNNLREKGIITNYPITTQVAATSVGIVENELVLDLCYAEDSNAAVDMNVVMTKEGNFVEIQGTGEQRPFTAEEQHSLLKLAQKGLDKIFEIQRQALEG